MAEYIDKKALIEGMVNVDGRRWSTKTLGEVLNAIGGIEIVRCKDCKYGEPNGQYGCKCYHYRLYETHEMSSNDFCSWGKRREEWLNL